MANDYIQKSEDMKQELEAKIKDIAENFHTNPEDIAEYLKFSSKFYGYSARNTMLIYQQNKGAAFCGSYKKFQDLGYTVRKGQHGMKILVPTKKTYLKINDEWVPLSKATKEQKQAYKQGKFKHDERLVFKVGTVFDIAQTNIPKEDYPKYLGIGNSSENHKKLYDLLVKYNNEKLGVQVRENQLQSVTLRGYYNPLMNDIVISGTFDDTTRLSILTHETGHAIMHDEKIINHQPTSQIEFEADCCSVMLATYMGVEVSETRCRHLSDSFNEMTKLQNYRPEMLQQSFDIAHRAFQQVTSYVDNHLENMIKETQLNIIKDNNVFAENYPTLIKNIDDILTYNESLNLNNWQEVNKFNPDYTLQMAKRAVNTGEITVYSPKPIEQGTFITPSKMEAEKISANGKVFQKTVKLNEIAWIDPMQGMYANTNLQGDTIQIAQPRLPATEPILPNQLPDLGGMIQSM